jgi:hypothetical protein
MLLNSSCFLVTTLQGVECVEAIKGLQARACCRNDQAARALL